MLTKLKQKSSQFITLYLVLFIVILLQVIIISQFWNIGSINSKVIISVQTTLLTLIIAAFYRTIRSINQLATLTDESNVPKIEAIAEENSIISPLSQPLSNLIGKNNSQFQSEQSILKEIIAKKTICLEELWEQIPIAAFIIQTTGEIICCNQNAPKVLGYSSQQELKNSSFYDLISSCYHEKVQVILSGFNQTTTLNSVIIKKDASRRPAVLHFFPNKTGIGNDGICIYLIDKTEELEKNTSSNDPKKQQFIYNIESLAALSGGIAHDFNNIMGAISGYAEIILTRYSGDEKLQKYGSMIHSAAQRATNLTNKLLLFAHRKKANLTSIDAHDQISTVIDVLFGASAETIQIERHFKAECSCIYGDCEQFQNAITNVMINAHEAMPNGGKLSIQTENRYLDQHHSESQYFTVAPGHYLAISITDSGIGMDQLQMSHLFEPFFTTKDKSKNNGLGLASIYGIIKNHKGSVAVESKRGTGTTFTLFFPVNMENENMVSKACNDNNKQTSIKNILLVDDDEIIQDAVGEMLRWLGFGVVIATNGYDAINLVENAPDRFDLIILDILMPQMNGKECYRKIKQINPNLKVLISTGYSTSEDKKELLNEGVVGILEKPFESAQLTQAIQEAMRGSKSQTIT